MQKYNIIVGIDPDREESGVATLNPTTKDIEIERLDFPALIDKLRNTADLMQKYDRKVVIVVEAGWLVNKSNYHTKWKGHIAEKIAHDVGANHETGKKIIEMATHFGLEVIPHAPLKKCWKGADGKITQEELKYFMPVKKRTNQDERDAALLAWAFADLPIRMNVNK